MFEVTQTTALSQETEEYAHDEISIVDARTAAVQFVAADEALGRSLEILTSLLTLRCPTAVVSERGALKDLDDRVSWVYELAPGLDPLTNAPLYALPASIFTYELARLRGGSYYASADELHDIQGDHLIYGSQILA
jgi:hypothetical protein